MNMIISPTVSAHGEKERKLRKMAFDDKRFKMMKWLEHIAKDNVGYAKFCYRSFTDILTIYGRLYATNGIILAEIQYPEFEHISDNDCFMYVTRYSEYKDGAWYLLEYPELAEYERELRPRIFTDMFPDRHFYDEGFAFDTKVMKDALKPFEIYKLSPSMCIDGDRCMLSAHDKDVSMRVLLMGVKRR